MSESGDVGGALAALSADVSPASAAVVVGQEAAPLVQEQAAPQVQAQPEPAPQVESRAEPQASSVLAQEQRAEPEPSQPLDPHAGLLTAYDAALRARGFSGTTVRKYKKYAEKFREFTLERGWESGTMPSDAVAQFLLDKMSAQTRGQAQQALSMWHRTLGANGVMVSPQDVPRAVVSKTATRKQKEALMAGKESLPVAPPSVLPMGGGGVSAPASVMPSAPAPMPAPMPMNGAALNGPPMPPGAAGNGAASARIPGVATYRIYRQVQMGDPGGSPPGSWSLINDFPAQDVPDVTAFIRAFLAPKYGPFMGGADAAYFVQSLDMRGGHVRHLDTTVRLAAERAGGFGGAGGFAGPQPQGYGPMGYSQPGYGQQPQQQQSAYSPEIQFILNQHKEMMAAYRAEVEAAKKQLDGNAGKMDPMMMMMLSQKLDRLQPPADPTAKLEELLMRGRMGGGVGGWGPNGGPQFDAYGQPVGFAPLPALPPAPAPNDTMAEIAKDALHHSFAAQKPANPIEMVETLARIQSLSKNDNRSSDVLLEMLRDQAKEARAEASELRKEVRELTANRKTTAEQMGEFIALKKGLVELGLAKDVDEDTGGDSLIGLFRDAVANAKEIGQGVREIVTATRSPVSAGDLKAEMAKRAGAGAGVAGARAALPAANVSSADALRAGEERARAEAAAAAQQAQQQQENAQKEPPPSGVIEATDALMALPAEGEPGWQGVDTEVQIITGVLSLVDALSTAPGAKAQALGAKIQELFLKCDSLGAMRNLITSVYVQMGAQAELLNNLVFMDKLAKALHHHYPSIYSRLMGGGERKPADWDSVWAARDAVAVAAGAVAAPTPAPAVETKPAAAPAPQAAPQAAPAPQAQVVQFPKPAPQLDAYELAVRAAAARAAAPAPVPTPAPVEEEPEEDEEDDEGEEDDEEGEDDADESEEDESAPAS